MNVVTEQHPYLSTIQQMTLAPWLAHLLNHHRQYFSVNLLLYHQCFTKCEEGEDEREEVEEDEEDDDDGGGGLRGLFPPPTALLLHWGTETTVVLLP